MSAILCLHSHGVCFSIGDGLRMKFWEDLLVGAVSLIQDRERHKDLTDQY